MHLVPYDKSKLKRTPKTNLFKLVKEFVDSDADCAMVAGAAEHYATPSVGATTINESIKRYKFAQIRAVVNNGEIYLVKEYK